ncbi:hypothetical protein WJX81_005882 [Elliptochloris bilobata]|uniref:RanBP2-type domain-containing protein n=1 Tax=Elliptochloris bilobata TaxID=381761 RepID=A0AAW1QN48_9CHLO
MVTLRLQGPGVDNFDATLQSDLITALAESMTTVGKAAIRVVLVADAFSFRRRRLLLTAPQGAALGRALLQLPLATDVTPAGHSGPLHGVKDVTVEINAGSGSRVALVEAELQRVVADNTVAEDAALKPEDAVSVEIAAVADSALPDEEESAAGQANGARYPEFESLWSSFVDALEVRGYFSDETDDGTQVPIAQKTEVGALKRAQLRLARARADIIYSLPEDKVVALAEATLPYPERKTANASKRLKATFIDKVDADEGVGGGANTVDLMRLVVAARVGLWQQEQREKELFDEGGPPSSGGVPVQEEIMKAVSAIIPDMLALLDKEPDEVALALAEAAQSKRDAEGTGVVSDGRAHDDWREPRARGRDNERRARAPRDSMENTMKPGDWSCPDCASHNFARRMECFRCGAPRPEGVGGPRGGDLVYGGARASRPYEQREGDWHCGCGADNFSFRTSCFRCDAPRPASAGPVVSRRSERSNRPAAQKQPGDWMCGACGQHNFRSRAECFKCAAPKSEGTVVSGDDADMGSGGEQWYGNDGGRGSYGRGGGGGGRGGSREDSDLSW